MNIYLDQNKWIDLARIYHGKDNSNESLALLDLIITKVESGEANFPLSSSHYLETASISNPGRKKRLGNTMFAISKGKTLASYKKIVTYEVENALSEYFNFLPCKLELIGYGFEHALDIPFPSEIPTIFRSLVERSCLTGEELLGNSMTGFFSKEHNHKFQNHLAGIHKIKEELPKSKWDDALYALALNDILPIVNKVAELKNIKQEDIVNLGKDNLSKILENMPSRALEIHLHKLILSNSSYTPKITDLDDWSGFALGSQYCDQAIGEKHMVDMLTRQDFLPKSKIHKSIFALTSLLSARSP